MRAPIWSAQSTETTLPLSMYFLLFGVMWLIVYANQLLHITNTILQKDISLREGSTSCWRMFQINVLDFNDIYTRAVWKFLGLTLFLRVGTLWSFLQRFTHSSKTCCRPFAASFRRIVEQAILTSWSLQARSSLFMVSLHRLHRLDGWVAGSLIYFFQVEHRIQSRNTPLRKYLVTPPS